MARRGGGAVARPDCIGQNTAFAYDFRRSSTGSCPDSEFTLDINNPQDPKVLCVGNNPRPAEYLRRALGLYNSRIVKAHQQERDAQIVSHHRRVADYLFQGVG